jgi:hypothetical protein
MFSLILLLEATRQKANHRIARPAASARARKKAMTLLRLQYSNAKRPPYYRFKKVPLDATTASALEDTSKEHWISKNTKARGIHLETRLALELAWCLPARQIIMTSAIHSTENGSNELLRSSKRWKGRDSWIYAWFCTGAHSRLLVRVHQTGPRICHCHR